MSEKPNDDKGNPRKRILDWGDRDKDILNNCLTILTDMLEDPSSADAKKKKIDLKLVKEEEKESSKASESVTKAAETEKEGNAVTTKTSGGVTTGENIPPMYQRVTIETDDLNEFYRQMLNYDVLGNENSVAGSGQQKPEAAKAQEKPEKAKPGNGQETVKKSQETGKNCQDTGKKCQETPRKEQNISAIERVAVGTGQDASGQNHITAKKSQDANATQNAAENFLKAEHELKMKQMEEAHEWAREEHVLKIQEQQLKIEYLKLQKQLVEKQL